MTDDELLDAMVLSALRHGGEISDVLDRAADRINALIAEHKEDQSVIAVWRGRTQRAEAEVERLKNPLRDALAFIAGVNSGCTPLVARIVTALATEDKP